MVEDFLCDPVLGVEVFFKAKLDAFQKSALRMFWWVPDVIDSSGFGTGKTFRGWLWANLRCSIIEDQWIWIYYQTFESGKQIFWPYYEQFNLRTSPLFSAQLGKVDQFGDDDGKDNKKGPAAFIQHFKNGSKIVMPAPGWFNSAKSQAGLTFNAAYMDEWTKVETMKPAENKDMVGGIDQQVIGRVRRQSFNQFHPLWGNHRKYSATAESPSHPAYKRYRMFQKEIARGNPNYAVLRYDYKDFSNLTSHSGKPFKEQIPDWKTIKNHKAMYTRAHSLREDHGIWARETAGWFSESALQRCVAAGIAQGTEIETARGQRSEVGGQRPEARGQVMAKEKAYYFLGVDPAPAQSKKADDGGLAILKVTRKDLSGQGNDPAGARPGQEHEELDELPSNNPSDWKKELVWAYRVRGETKRALDEGIFLAETTSRWSGLIHWKHSLFGLSGIGLDPQAGGAGGLIAADMSKTRQWILGAERDVVPICALGDVTSGVGSFILTMFKRSDPGIKALWPMLQGDDNLIDALMMVFQQEIEQASVLFPKPFNERPREETMNWPKEKSWALKNLDAARKQFENIQVVTRDDGMWAVTGHGAKQYVAAGKKDLAYAILMAYLRFLVWLKMNEMDFSGEGEGEDGGCYVF